MDDVEIRRVHYFVAVAEELNFTRAAHRLTMTQPALSRAIRGLEKTLGVTLFERTTNGVGLTSAGEVMLAESRSLLAHLDRSLSQVRRVAAPGDALTVTGPGCDAALLDELVRAYNDTGPPRPARTVVGTLGDRLDPLRTGRADLVLWRGAPEAGLDGVLVGHLPTHVMVAAGHHLADRRRTVRVADLADEPLVGWRGSPDPLGDPALWPDGLPGRAGPEVSDGLQMLAVVRLGQAVALTAVPAFGTSTPEGTVALRLADGPRVPLRLLWARAGGTADARRFARHAVTALRDRLEEDVAPPYDRSVRGSG
ncbi:LysR family transcriptional regulator [Streptomyces sp. CRN 30]|uniref:LysR family transcriptional regulator n=1 Tax=Streptomyces sp. CRN 30 TaxID=3075613 RepID=UPI002A802635|nr:LysR family transcriptional regulator [Streptomyces sp. CRN 30]